MMKKILLFILLVPSFAFCQTAKEFEYMRFKKPETDSMGIGKPATALLTVSNTPNGLTPQSGTMLHLINDNTSNGRISNDSYYSGGFQGSILQGRRARGTAASPTAPIADDILLALGGDGYGDDAFHNISVGSIAIRALNTFTNTSAPTYIAFNTSSDGTITNTERMRISSTGSLRLFNYGAGTITGTPAYGLSVDASGNVIETAASSGGVDEDNVIHFTDFITAATTANIPFTGAAISSGTNAANTTNLNGNRPGVVRMTSSTTANGGYRWATDATSIRIKGNETFTVGIAPVNFTTTTVRTGFLDATTVTDAVDGIYFEYATNGNIVLKTSNNSTRTTSSTITTLALNTWYKLKIIVNADATSVTGYVYDAAGALISSQTITTNIPTAAGRECGAGIVATESTTTATAMVDLDFLYLKFILVR